MAGKTRIKRKINSHRLFVNMIKSVVACFIRISIKSSIYIFVSIKLINLMCCIHIATYRSGKFLLVQS